MTKRSYSDAERSVALGILFSSPDVFVAAERSGVPVRTLSRWKAQLREGDGLASRVVGPETRQQLRDDLRVGAAEGVAALLAIIRNPGSADRDKVRAAEVLLDKYQTVEGIPTRTENVNLNANLGALSPQEHHAQYLEEQAALGFLRQIQALDDDGLRQWLAETSFIPDIKAIEAVNPAREET